MTNKPTTANPALPPDPPAMKPVTPKKSNVEEFGGPKGLEPTRYGDWEQKGRCTDF